MCVLIECAFVRAFYSHMPIFCPPNTIIFAFLSQLPKITQTAIDDDEAEGAVAAMPYYNNI